MDRDKREIPGEREVLIRNGFPDLEAFFAEMDRLEAEYEEKELTNPHPTDTHTSPSQHH